MAYTNKYGPTPKQAGWDFLGWGENTAAGANQDVFRRTGGKVNPDTQQMDINWWERLWGANEADLENLRTNKLRSDIGESELGVQGDMLNLAPKRGETRGQFATRVDAAQTRKNRKDVLVGLGGPVTNDMGIAGINSAIETLENQKFDRSPEGKRQAFEMTRATNTDNRANTALDNQNNIAERTLDQQGEKMSADERRFFAQMEMSRADNAANRLQEIRLMQMKSDADELRYQQDREYYEQDKQQAALAALVASLASLGGAFTI